jgi:hypothetical protein
MKYSGLLLIAGMLAGCASPDPFRENISKLIDCEYEMAGKQGLTCQQIFDLQAGCYTLYQMRRKP